MYEDIKKKLNKQKEQAGAFLKQVKTISEEQHTLTASI